MSEENIEEFRSILRAARERLERQAKIEVLKEVLAYFENCIGVECDDLVIDKLKQLEGEK